MSRIEHFLNKIHHADCMDMMRVLPDKCIDLVLTDPPYGIRMARGTNIRTRNSKVGFNGAQIHNQKNWDNFPPSKEYFDEILRISKNAIIFGGNYFADKLPVSRCWIVWDKKEHKTQGCNFADAELAWTSFDRNVKLYQYGWVGLDYVNNSKGDKRIHPTQKPLVLFSKIIRDFSSPGDLIFDPFAGSGTTGIAALANGHDFICVEKDTDYYKSACDRIVQEQQNLFRV